MAPATLHGLAGKRIALTRPSGQVGDFAEVVLANGGIPVVRPAIRIEEVESTELADVIRSGKRHEWVVFTSANAVSAFHRALGRLGLDPARQITGRIAAVGQATAARLEECFRSADLVSSGESAESLAREMGNVANARVLFPRGELAMTELPRALTSMGATLDSPVLYRTVPSESAATLAVEWESGLLDAVLFASPSAVRAVAAALDSTKMNSQAVRNTQVFCLGESTARAARAAGFAVSAVAKKSTQEGLLETAAQWFENDQGKRMRIPQR